MKKNHANAYTTDPLFSTIRKEPRNNFDVVDPRAKYYHLVAVVETGSPILPHLDLLAERTGQITQAPSLASANNMAKIRGAQTLLLFSFDLFHDLDDAVNGLRLFRASSFEVPIIAASSFFDGHNFYGRADLADVLLRTPFGPAILALAIGAAIDNHTRFLNGPMNQ